MFLALAVKLFLLQREASAGSEGWWLCARRTCAHAENNVIRGLNCSTTTLMRLYNTRRKFSTVYSMSGIAAIKKLCGHGCTQTFYGSSSICCLLCKPPPTGVAQLSFLQLIDCYHNTVCRVAQLSLKKVQAEGSRWWGSALSRFLTMRTKRRK
jgi:hypothetical protein